MKIVVYLPPDCHSHFHLIVEERLESGELEPEDQLALDRTLLAAKRIAKRLARVDAQTSPQ